MKKILSLLIGLIALILILEMGLRFLAYFYNREPREIKPIQKNVIRVVTVGESTTAVAANEDGTYLVKNTAYPNFLERYLNQGAKNRKFEVVNKGIMSGDTNKVIAELENYLKNNQVDLVIAMIGMKDESNTTVNSLRYKINKFFQFSKVYNLINLSIDEWQISKTDINDYKEVNEYKDLNLQFLKIAKDEVYLNIAKQALSEKYDDKRIAKILPSIYLANYFYNTGNLVKAEQLYLQLIESDEHGYFALADVYLRNDHVQDAIKILKKYLLKYPYNNYAKKELVSLLIKVNQTKKAKTELAGTEDQSIFITMANEKIAYAEGNLKLAEELLARDCNVHKFKSVDRVNQKRALMDHLEFILNKFEYDNCALELSKVYVENGKFELAENLLKNYLAINSSDFAATNMLRHIYKIKNDENKSLDVLKQSAFKSKRLGDYLALMQEFKRKKLSFENNEIVKIASEDFFETKNNIKKLYHLTYKHGGRLVLVQYPTFDVSFLKSLARDYKGILFVDNETIFDDSPKNEYLFEPKYPYKFNHYTRKGAEKLAENISKNILSFYSEGILQ